MSTEHTIVVRFEGSEPTYSANTDCLGGRVVAVDFTGNRLQVEQELLSALEDAKEALDLAQAMTESSCHHAQILGAYKAARAAIANATIPRR